MDFTNMPRRNKTYTGAGNDAWNFYNKREGKAFRKKREDIGYIFKAAEKRLTYTEKEARFPGFFQIEDKVVATVGRKADKATAFFV